MTAKQFISRLAELRLIPLPGNIRSRRLRFNHSAPAKIETFTVEEVRQMLAAAQGLSERTKLYLLLMLNCGMYQNDIAELRNDEIDWKAGTIARAQKQNAGSQWPGRDLQAVARDVQPAEGTPQQGGARVDQRRGEATGSLLARRRQNEALRLRPRRLDADRRPARAPQDAPRPQASCERPRPQRSAGIPNSNTTSAIFWPIRRGVWIKSTTFAPMMRNSFQRWTGSGDNCSGYERRAQGRSPRPSSSSRSRTIWAICSFFNWR